MRDITTLLTEEEHEQVTQELVHTMRDPQNMDKVIAALIKWPTRVNGRTTRMRVD